MRPASDLASRTWQELVGTEPTVVVPVGAVEQHGPHLPLDTDARIARGVAAAMVDSLDDGDALLAPSIDYGASGEHEGFPGTVSIGREALETLLVEYGRSAMRWARRLVFVNAHGGNAHAVVGAVRLLRYEGRDAAWLPCAFPDADAHAGRTETSVLMALGHDVRADRMEPGNTAPISELLDDLRAGGVAAVSPNGVLGDPAGSTAAGGRRLIDDLARDLASAVGRWDVDDNGRLA